MSALWFNRVFSQNNYFLKKKINYSHALHDDNISFEINRFLCITPMFQRLEVTPRATSVSKRSRAIPRLRSTTEVIPKSGRSNVPFAIEGFQQRYDQNRIYF